mgnify:CR=1 FL=1
MENWKFENWPNLKTIGADITFVVDLFTYVQIKLSMFFYVSFKWQTLGDCFSYMHVRFQITIYVP